MQDRKRKTYEKPSLKVADRLSRTTAQPSPSYEKGD